MNRLLPFAAAVLLAGCAHAEPRLAAGGAPPERVLLTGSRIPQAVDPATGRARTALNVRVYATGDLVQTGALDLGAALRDAMWTPP